jgi:hypothetical protein
MKKEDKGRIPLPMPSSTDLRGRQSVRATFKLSTTAIDALSIVAIHLGIKQKSLFDHLIEDTDTLTRIAEDIEAEAFRQLDRTQKTFVISRRTLTCLEDISRRFNAPRDALVEYSIQRLVPVIAAEREKHARRKKMVENISAFLNQGHKLLVNVKSEVGEDDPVYVRFQAAIHALESACDIIDAYVAKGKIIEDF